MSDRSATIRVRVNDNDHELPVGSSVASLLNSLGLEGRRGVAIAIGEQVIPRSRWPERNLAEGERILVIQATQGG